MLNDKGDHFHFLPQQSLSSNADDGVEPVAGPGPSTAEYRLQQLAAASGVPLWGHRVLDDADDGRVVDIHPTAGEIMDPATVPVKKCTGLPVDKDGDTVMGSVDDNPFHPFNSELDWQIAQWKVKEGPGDSAFDWLLEIPEVCVHYFVWDQSTS